MPAAPSPLLQARGLGVRFGGLTALANLSLTIGQAELIGVLGPNGAGKTTLFHVMSGIVVPTTGTLHLDGADVTGEPPFVYGRRGVARTFQTPRLFREATAIDNVMFGARFARRRAIGGDPRGARRSGRAREAALRDAAAAALARVGLADLADRRAGDLPPARQRTLEIAMAIATAPRLLLLDEVAAGLTEGEANQTATLIRALFADLGITILWIEHAVGTLMRAVDRVLVLDHGELIADGPPATVASDRGVIAAYLGVDEEGS